MDKIYKTPRLYTDTPLTEQGTTELTTAQAHYLKSVLRKNSGENIRIFNGQDGEWLGQIEELGKKSGTITLKECLQPQPQASSPLHLLFAPIKKNRMDFLIEKAVELGVTDLHPVITTRTESRKLNHERISAQIIEAAEQCERLDLPKLHTAQNLPETLRNWPENITVFWGAERLETATPITEVKNPQAFLIGPEGGFDKTEQALLKSTKNATPISLGQNILRAETAALTCISIAKLSL